MRVKHMCGREVLLELRGRWRSEEGKPITSVAAELSWVESS